MTFITNAGSLAVRKRILAGKTAAEFGIAARLQAAEMKRIAIQESNGALDTAELRRRGHPYARRFPVNSAGQLDSLINEQTGDFKKSWKTRVSPSGKRWLITLYNTSDHAKFMLGTRRMRERPITEEILRQMKPIWPRPVKKAIQKAVTANNVSSAPLPSAPVLTASVSPLALPGAVSGAEEAISGSGGGFGSFGGGGGMSGGSSVLFGIAAGLSSVGSAVSGAIKDN